MKKRSVRKITHGSLFSGIGGFDLAAEWVEWENVFHCEWNEFGRKILNYYWPESISYNDITQTDFTIHRGRIDILTGGFPCQPFSNAGKRKGASDDRYLWPEMLRAIDEIRPSYVIGENVLGITSMVFESYSVKVESEKNIEGETIHRTMESDSVIMRIVDDLESRGYSVQPIIVPACSINAPHRRDRVWFIASDTNEPNERHSDRRTSNETEKEIRWNNESNVSDSLCSNGSASDRKSRGIHFTKGGWNEFPTQSAICSGNDGISYELDGITFPKWRKESLKGYGNAIVPQVAFEFFRMINVIELQSQFAKRVRGFP